MTLIIIKGKKLDKNIHLLIAMKQSSITFKTTSELKESLEKLAKEGFRSLSAQVEMIIIKYLEEKGVDWRNNVKKKS